MSLPIRLVAKAASARPGVDPPSMAGQCPARQLDAQEGARSSRSSSVRLKRVRGDIDLEPEVIVWLSVTRPIAVECQQTIQCIVVILLSFAH